MISASDRSPFAEHKSLADKTFLNFSKNEFDSSDLPIAIQQELIDFESLLESFDLNQMGAPFLPNTLQVARKKLYTKIQLMMKKISSEELHTLVQSLMIKIDTDVFVVFVEKITMIYRDLVWKKHYKLPSSVKLFEMKDAVSTQEYQSFCYSIADWLVQVEISGDLIARAELYGIHTAKSKLNLSEVEQRYIIEKGTLDRIAQKVTNHVINNTISYISNALSLSKHCNEISKWSKLTSLAERAFGGDQVIWSLFASGTNIAYAIGGYLVSQILNGAKRQVTERQINEDMMKLKLMTQRMNEFLCSLNQDLQRAINACFKISDEKGKERESLEASSKINLLIEYLSSGKIIEECHLLTEENVSLITKESREGWIVCDLEILEERNGEEDFVVFDFGQ